MDKLEHLFSLQKVFQERLYGVSLPHSLPEMIPMQVTSIVAELGEVLKENEKWKDWKSKPRQVDDEELLGEIADLWHFIINLSLYLGFDADDIYNSFVSKNEVNNERQDQGY
jgi:dimeric dUTPase (all-alpha-NTP-PPase superfamily)